MAAVPITAEEASSLVNAIMRSPHRAATPNHPAQPEAIHFHVTNETAPILHRLFAAAFPGEQATRPTLQEVSRHLEIRPRGDDSANPGRAHPGSCPYGPSGERCDCTPGHDGAHASAATRKTWSNE